MWIKEYEDNLESIFQSGHVYSCSIIQSLKEIFVVANPEIQCGTRCTCTGTYTRKFGLYRTGTIIVTIWQAIIAVMNPSDAAKKISKNKHFSFCWFFSLLCHLRLEVPKSKIITTINCRRVCILASQTPLSCSAKCRCVRKKNLLAFLCKEIFHLFSNNLDKCSFWAPSVKLAIENLLPDAEIQITFGNSHYISITFTLALP
jgi:hypothetical protein